MEIKEKLQEAIQDALQKIGVVDPKVSLELTEDLNNGDYFTNVALVYAKELGKNPIELAEDVVKEISPKDISGLEKVEVAKPGFINFFLSKDYFAQNIAEILDKKDRYGKTDLFKDQKTIVEFTDPNPFKEFHIGHVMSNTIGESISRLISWGGADVKRACYQGDVGLHVAKAIWGMQDLAGEMPEEKSALADKIAFLGKSYVHGSNSYEDDEEAKKEIISLNKLVFSRGDLKINALYDWGRKASLEGFEEIYQKLGTKFDFYFFESESGKFGKEIVEQNTPNVFLKSDGAVVFHAEKLDPKLHTRVFINSEGLPTYEAKELGLAKIKFEKFPYDKSIVITGNEVDEYFKVLLKAMEIIFPDLAQKNEHISHGMLRFSSGKMSSRKGNVVTGASLIEDVKSLVQEKMKDREIESGLKEKIIEQVAVGAIKYSILRQSIGGDIIFDFEKSVSFEGDSGPYVQYAHTRAQSVLKKAVAENIELNINLQDGWESVMLEKLLVRFKEVVLKSQKNLGAHYLVTYITELSSAFNAWYANEKIVDKDEITSPYRLAITNAFEIVLKNGLDILGIPVPEEM